MNWLGLDARGLLGALVGLLLGVVAFVALRLHAELDLPPVVGLGAGLGAMALSHTKSGTRGIVVGSLAAWACALSEVILFPTRGSALRDLYHFSERLDLTRLTLFFASVGLAAILGTRSRRPSARAASDSAVPTSDSAVPASANEMPPR